MNYDRRIIKAFESNDITRILLIDDAYDPPEIDEGLVAKFADFLESDAGRNTCIEYDIPEDLLVIATSAASEGNYESEELYHVNDVLYTNFVQELDDRFDPGGIFKDRKEVALKGLIPLYKLLCSCAHGNEVHTAGLNNGIDCYKESNPQVLFIDYYLSDDVPPNGDVKEQKGEEARNASIELLNKIIDRTAKEEEIPAIILMSSHEVEDNNKYLYRHDTDSDKIMSLRFQFLKKEMVKYDGTVFDIHHTAADALLDTSQGYRFGIVLQQALEQWKKGAEAALSSFIGEIGDLDIKDFAYLLRFKLREDGQPLGEYLQWFFGECLKGLIDEKVDWQHDSFTKLDSEPNLDESIEGAFEGPTKRIAELFHRVKMDCYRRTTHITYRMGDIYAKSGENAVKAIVTPDCDLIKHNGEPNVKNILTMRGTLIPFGREDSAADDFFIYNEKPYSVLWKPKVLQMFPISDEDGLHSANDFEFLGTLRPLYAQEMQRRVINDLSRVGLPVAPALGINTAVAVCIRKKVTPNQFDKIEINPDTHATLIPARRGQDSSHTVLVKRSFINELMDRLSEIEEPEMHVEDIDWLNKALSESGMEEIYDQFLRKGVKIGEEGKGPVGIGVKLGKKHNKTKDASWLQINLIVSDEMIEELQIIDPIHGNSVENFD